MPIVGRVRAIEEERKIIIEWKIDDFLQLGSHESCWSPDFDLSGASGYLVIQLRGPKRDAPFESASIYLQLTSMPGHCANATATFSLRTVDGGSDLEETAIFVETGKRFSFHNFICQSDLMRRKSELLPSGTLTVIFTLKDSGPNAVTTGCDKSQLPAANTCNKLHVDFKELFLKQEYCDVVLKVRGREFSAHRLILGARSPVFASAFRNEMKEKATGVIDIEDCDPSSFSDFLCFLYCGNAEDISTTNVFGLFVTADKYDVQDLRSECLKFMKSNLSVDTFCDAITLALQHSEKMLLDLATDFFAENIKKIITTDKWEAFLLENPIQSNKLLIRALSNKK